MNRKQLNLQPTNLNVNPVKSSSKSAKQTVRYQSLAVRPVTNEAPAALPLQANRQPASSNANRLQALQNQSRIPPSNQVYRPKEQQIQRQPVAALEETQGDELFGEPRRDEIEDFEDPDNAEEIEESSEHPQPISEAQQIPEDDDKGDEDVNQRQHLHGNSIPDEEFAAAEIPANKRSTVPLGSSPNSATAQPQKHPRSLSPAGHYSQPVNLKSPGAVETRLKRLSVQSPNVVPNGASVNSHRALVEPEPEEADVEMKQDPDDTVLYDQLEWINHLTGKSQSSRGRSNTRSPMELMLIAIAPKTQMKDSEVSDWAGTSKRVYSNFMGHLRKKLQENPEIAQQKYDLNPPVKSVDYGKLFPLSSLGSIVTPKERLRFAITHGYLLFLHVAKKDAQVRFMDASIFYEQNKEAFQMFLGPSIPVPEKLEINFVIHFFTFLFASSTSPSPLNDFQKEIRELGVKTTVKYYLE